MTGFALQKATVVPINEKIPFASFRKRPLGMRVDLPRAGPESPESTEDVAELGLG